MADRVTIGRTGCDINLPGDEYVSPRHAEVWTDSAGVTRVADLGSTNGTRLIPAGRPVPSDPIGLALAGVKVTAPVRVRPGDTLIVGRTPIVLPIRREPIRVQVEQGEPRRDAG